MDDRHLTTLKAPLEHVVLRWAKNYVEVHKEMLYTKYQSSRPSSFREEEFWSLLLCSYILICDPQDGASFNPRGIIWTNLVQVQ